MNLELYALRWLWLEKTCHYIVEQRSPRYLVGSPDVLGVTKSRCLIEIEIKRSRSDFKADANKPQRYGRNSRLKSLPRQIYYLMPPNLAEKLIDEIPEWGGLLTIDSGKVIVMKDAPINKESRKLTLKECTKMARCIVNYAMSMRCSVRDSDTQTWIDFMPATVGTYEI